MRSDKWLNSMDDTVTDGWNGPTQLEMGVLSPASWKLVEAATGYQGNKPFEVPPDYEESEPEPETDRHRVLREALELVGELWPQPSSASVTMETHTWLKLRRTLLAVPDLVIDAEKQDS
jgi:hypothetical protein